MEITRELREEMIIKDSWIPQTPYKPLLTGSPPIYPERERNQQKQAIWVESEKYPAGVFPAPQSDSTAECLRPTVSSEFSMETVSGLNNLCCGDLLALADAAALASTHGNHNMAKDSSFSITNSQIDGRRMESGHPVFSFANSHFSVGPNTWIARSETMQKSQNELSASNQHSYDLNFPPGTVANKVSNKISEFAPITPDKGKRVEGEQLSETVNLCSEGTNQKGTKEGNKATSTSSNSDRTQCSNVLTQHITDSLITQPSKENHNPDMGGNDTDINKTPQQKPKRRKHRPKVVTEGKPKRTRKSATTNPDPKENQTPKPKRKYVRKKPLNKGSTPLPAEASGESSEPKTLRSIKKSARRALNFDKEEPRDENTTCVSTFNLHSEIQVQNCCNKENLAKSTTQLPDRVEVMVENTQEGDTYNLSPSSNQALSVSDGQAPSTPLPTKTNPPGRRKRNAPSQKENNEGEIGQLIIKSQEDMVKIMSHLEAQPRGPNDKDSTSTLVTEEGQANRNYSRSTDPAKTCITNAIGIRYNMLQAYQRISWVHFPNIHKKKRTEKSQNSGTSSTSSSITASTTISGQETRVDPSTSTASYWTSPQSDANRVPTPLEEAQQSGLQDKLQSIEYIRGISQSEKFTKKRSRGIYRARNLLSLSRIVDCNMYLNYPGGNTPAQCDRQGSDNSPRSHPNIEAIVADMQSTLARKKRTKKRNTFVNPTSSSAKELQMHHQIVLNDHQKFSALPLGTTPGVLWNQMSIEAISEQLKVLDINREGNHIPCQEQNAITIYKMGNEEQNALVLYRRDGTLVPFYPIKKRRPRPKVDLDDETNRVWKLLIGNINSEGIDGTDEEKIKWWEEERRVFRGRADSFIARMHLVQGDRRFSPWKGSVVDSVIGVFLTQNVSDHLSSSAFMSVAARFPLKSNSTIERCHEEGAISVTHEPIVYLVDSEETVSDKPVCGHSSMTVHDPGYNEKEALNYDETSRSSSDVVLDSSGGALERCYYSKENNSTTEIGGIETVFCDGEKRTINDKFSSPDSVLLSQNSLDSSAAQTAERIGSCSESNSEGEDLTNGTQFKSLKGPTSFMELLQMAGSSMPQKGYGHENNICSDSNSIDKYIQSRALEYDNERISMDYLSGNKSCLRNPIISSCNCSSDFNPKSGVVEIESFEEETRSDVSKNKKEYSTTEESPFRSEPMSQTAALNNVTVSIQEATTSISSDQNNHSSNSFQEDEYIIAQTNTNFLGDCSTIFESEVQVDNKELQNLNFTSHSGVIPDVTESTNALDNKSNTQGNTPQSDLNNQGYAFGKQLNDMNAALKSSGRTAMKKNKDDFEWDSLRRQTETSGRKKERTANTMDSVDWEAVRSADVNEIAQTIKERGMNNMLAERIKAFLDRLVKDHGSIDLEWLRDIPPDKAKEYLLSIRGLGLKSVECVRLLTLHHLAFPVDTNVGRIAVRLGWVPLQPLPESLQLHLLELYPVLESIQKYLWPRLCKLDQRTLYELHYQMITFGKVFCTKSKPNCNSCPMRGECRHFASAFASARLALPGPEEKSIVSRNENTIPDQNPTIATDQKFLPPPQVTEQSEGQQNSEANIRSGEKPGVSNYEPIVEEPATPEPECIQALENDMEDAFCDDPDEIPTIKLNMEEFTQNLQNYMQENMELQEGDMSKALVALTAEAASIPMPKLKNISRLRTEHNVYELPDSHPLLKGFDKREPDDPCSYLLAIWTPGETANSIQPPESRCSSKEHGQLCDDETCYSCNSIREAQSQTVRGTLLIPCRTAMRGSFPLNGTYFQVNEVFADHDSSMKPIDVPRNLIWHLPRRTVYFGTSIPTIFKGLTTEGIQHCFWRGYVCVRGFDKKTRAPRPLMARLHFPASKLIRTKGKTGEDNN